MAFQHSGNLRKSSVQKLLRMQKVARNMKICQKVAEQLVDSPKWNGSFEIQIGNNTKFPDIREFNKKVVKLAANKFD